ncbi:IS30 family transposase [Streptococcus pluranimalium]|uniref:IS30 family transposase n=1 Tax=Streptococcus pluranimalium TaxID=82348 RepID=UPI003F691382
MTYTHLTTNELVMIEAYYQAGKKVCDIAKSLGRSRQTISNVLSFLKAGYSAYDYYERYKTNKKRCGRKNTHLTKPVQDFIQLYLELDWSLDVIKGTYPDNIPCSMRTLYRLADRAERYPEFESEFGHLEGDTIVGKNHKSAVITLVEKQSKAIITLQTNGRKASDIEESVSQWLSQFPRHLFKSITFDCGKEFSNWKSISNKHDIDIFFADPGCPGQRGLNEHSNGLLRRHRLPKQMDFNDISQNYLSAIADKRNRIPRKSLNYLTPYQVFLTNLKWSNLI